MGVEGGRPGEDPVVEAGHRPRLSSSKQLLDLGGVAEHGAVPGPGDALPEEEGLGPPWEVEGGVAELGEE